MAQIRCVVERITYQNPENDYSVFRVKIKVYDDLVTLGQLAYEGHCFATDELLLGTTATTPGT